MRPLEGLLVLDFSTLLPGPMATLLLAEAGAEVIKIERPGEGEDMRGFEPKWGRDSVNFALLNRGKKSVGLDLKNPDDLAALLAMADRADIIVEQFRPGVMDRLGLGYPEIAARNPRMIYCSITGYGQTGPKRDVAGHDLNYIGDTGLLALSHGAAPGVIPPALVADIAAGAYPAVMNILLAIQERQRTGRGRHLDIAMADNLFPFMFWALGKGLTTNEWPGNATDLLSGGTPRYRLYATRDDKLVAAAPIEQKFWDVFCDIIGLEQDLRDDARDSNKTAMRVEQLIAAADAETWRARFAGRDCCCSIVADLKEALADPHFRVRGLLQHRLTNEQGSILPALPVPIDSAFRGAVGERLGAPLLGSDTEAFVRTAKPS